MVMASVFITSAKATAACSPRGMKHPATTLTSALWKPALTVISLPTRLAEACGWHRTAARVKTPLRYRQSSLPTSAAMCCSTQAPNSPASMARLSPALPSITPMMCWSSTTATAYCNSLISRGMAMRQFSPPTARPSPPMPGPAITPSIRWHLTGEATSCAPARISASIPCPPTTTRAQLPPGWRSALSRKRLPSTHHL